MRNRHSRVETEIRDCGGCRMCLGQKNGNERRVSKEISCDGRGHKNGNKPKEASDGNAHSTVYQGNG